MRLFVAVQFAPNVKEVLENVITDLREQTESGNFTRPENLHLTLAFIGETPKVALAKAAVDACGGLAFPLTVSGAGHFGDLYWVGIQKSPPLEDLAAKVQSALLDRGFSIEKRAFRPHITVARQVEAASPLRIQVPKTTMRVRRISLMKSERIQGVLTYTEIYGKDLA